MPLPELLKKAGVEGIVTAREARPMCFFFSLLPATVWLTVGYFVLFAAFRSDGGIKTFGQSLAVWLFVIAAVIPLAGAYVSLTGLCPIEDMLTTMHAARAAQ